MPYYTVPETLAPSAVRTNDGQSEPIEVSEYLEAHVLLDVTEASGTDPTLDLVIETSPDKSNWFTHTTFSQKTAAGKDLRTLSNLGRFIRARWTIGGTAPSFTFSAGLVGKGLQ